MRAEQTALEEDEAPAEPAPEGVSLTGIVGGLMGLGPLLFIAIGVLIDPGDSSRAWALFFGLPAAIFVPAIYVSWKPTPYRRTVLRATVIGCLILAFAGALWLVLIPIILMPATALLAIAAGLIFQGRQGEDAKKR